MGCKPLDDEAKAICHAIGWPDDSVIYPWTSDTDRGFSMWCPGCRERHTVSTSTGRWSFSGTASHPTFTPSILVTWEYGDGRTPKRCHSFVRDGAWQFLSDCTHELAGQTVAMVPDPARTGDSSNAG